MYDRIKAWLSDDSVFYALLILLIGIASFGLGRWSIDPQTLSDRPASIIFSDNTDLAITHDSKTIDGSDAGEAVVSPAAPGKFVASKNGSKYHFPWCPGAQQMKESNKVWFESKAAAEAAGYTPAANCKGL